MAQQEIDNETSAAVAEPEAPAAEKPEKPKRAPRKKAEAKVADEALGARGPAVVAARRGCASKSRGCPGSDRRSDRRSLARCRTGIRRTAAASPCRTARMATATKTTAASVACQRRRAGRRNRRHPRDEGDEASRSHQAREGAWGRERHRHAQAGSDLRDPAGADRESRA